MEYRNFASKVLLSRQWENQHLVPLEQPKSRQAFMRFLSKTFLPPPDISKVEIKAPIFIIGTPRCGSTMLQETMCNHEKIAYFTNTMDTFYDAKVFRAADWLRKTFNLDVRGERYLKDSVIVDGSTPSEAMRFWAESLRLDPFLLTWPERRIKDFSAEEIKNFKDYLKYVIAAFAERGGERFLNKSPALNSEVLLLQDLFPDAKFVYLIRDGRMVANSMLKLYKLQRAQDIKVNHPMFKDKPFVPYPRVPGLEEAAEKWGLEDIRTTATVWNSSVQLMNKIRPEVRNLHEIRFEDLVAEPKTELKKILDFCELPLPVRNREIWDAHIAKIGVIHHKNSYSGFEVVEKIAGDSLRQYGYL